MRLKVLANSGPTGSMPRSTSRPPIQNKTLPGEVNSDVCYQSPKVRDGRPGAYSNPITASLIIEGARLLLAMPECEVDRRAGIFAFCDTDSLAIVCGDQCRDDIPCLSKSAIDEIVLLTDCSRT